MTNTFIILPVEETSNQSTLPNTESPGLQVDEVKDESHHPLPRRVSMPPGVLSCSKRFFEFYELQYIM